MIAYLQGILTAKLPMAIEMNVGGVGYALQIPLSTYDHLPGLGEELRILTHQHVREDALTLYGFMTLPEKSMFGMLIAISGIGPKVALAIQSTLDNTSIEQAVLNADERPLCAVPGIGKKTASRILLEMRDKIMKRSKKQGKGVPGPAEIETSHVDSSPEQDAISALITLGFSYQDASRSVTLAAKDLQGNPPVEVLIRKGLNQFQKK